MLPAAAGALAERQLRLATRGSPLALAQAHIAASALRRRYRGEVEIVPVTTAGDRSQAAGDRLDVQARAAPGLFSSEIEAALLAGEADIAVHSLKDLPTAPHPDTVVAAILRRADPADILVIHHEAAAGVADSGENGLAALTALPPAARVGTSSPRRCALLAHHAPQVVVEAARGNIGTRLDRCRGGQPSALVLAAAGIDRLQDGQPLQPLEGLQAIRLAPKWWQPAPAQGALALQLSVSSWAREIVASCDDSATRRAVTLERACLTAVGGGCAQAIGAWAEAVGASLWRLHLGYVDDGRWRARVATDTSERLEAAVAAWSEGGEAPGADAIGMSSGQR